MSEIIPHTPESDTTPERYYWDQVIRGLEELSYIEPEIDVFEELDGLREEDQEDALILLYNYSVMLEVPEGESDGLEVTDEFLKRHEFIEGSDNEI